MRVVEVSRLEHKPQKASSRFPRIRPSFAVVTSICLLVIAGCGERPGKTPPSVLLVTIDTLRADYLTPYGFPRDTSPNIQRLAEDSVVFDRAIAASTRTAPAHASIMTSRYTRQHSIGFRNGDAVLNHPRPLAEHFRSAGYATAAFVGNAVLRKASGFPRGFEHYDDELLSRERNRSEIYERIAEHTNARALAWLEQLDAKPFFLWVHYQDPHGPYTPPEAFEGRFALEPEKDEVALEVVDSPGGWNTIPGYQALEGLALPSEYRGRYADEIFYTDHAIATLLRAVDAHDPDREVIVLLTSDHGESLGEAERFFSHGFSTTPQLAHVPMILRASALSAERRAEAVSHVDILPTLLELAGLDVPGDASGIALGEYLRDGRALPAREVYCDIGSEVSAYSGDTFTRILGLGGAWKSGERPEQRSWLTFAWQDDSNWPMATPVAALADATRTYIEKAMVIELQTAVSQENREALRLLGYIIDSPEQTDRTNLTDQPDQRALPDDN